MNDLKTKSTLEMAEELFQTATEELCRPEEDVVPYMVCSAAYKSVNKYLIAFLLKNDIEIHSTMSMEVLLKLCRDIDPRFKELNLDPMLQSTDDEKIWTNMGTVRKFIDIATQTRQLVGSR